MRLRTKLITAALLLALTASPAAQAATVHLKDGTTVQGTVVSATARDVTLHRGDGTTQSVPAEQIARIDYGGAAPTVPAKLEYREPMPKQEVSINLGLAVPLDRLDFSSLGGGSASNGSPGAQIGLSYMGAHSPRLWSGLAFEYLGRTRTGSNGGLPLAVTDVSGDTLLFLGQSKYVLRPGREVRPYARAAIGAHRTTTIVDATPERGFAWADTLTSETRRLIDASSWGFAAAAGLGIDFAWAEPSFFSLEVGWTGLTQVDHESAPAGRALGLAGGSSTLNILTVGGRFGWRF